jgi:hypothetical protein
MIVPAFPFRRERDMLPLLAKSLPSAVVSDQSRLVSMVREPAIGAVIPDVLLGEWPLERSYTARARCNAVEAYILALLEQVRSLTLRELMSRLHLPEEAGKRATRALIKRGAVVERARKRIALAESARTDCLEIVAVEAKMLRWREALVQATGYLQWANRAYVVLDGNQVTLTPRLLASFSEAGVGLALQRQFVLTVVLPARRHSPICASRVRAADALFATAPNPRSMLFPALTEPSDSRPLAPLFEDV